MEPILVYAVNRKKFMRKKFKFKTFVVKNFRESPTQRIVRLLIFSRLQSNAHACVLRTVMDDEMLSCVHGYHIYTTFGIRA